jgi:hypothetical protein
MPSIATFRLFGEALATAAAGFAGTAGTEGTATGSAAVGAGMGGTSVVAEQATTAAA